MVKKTDEELIALIALLAVDGVGPRRCKRLLANFGTAIEVFSASFSDLVQIEDIGEQTAQSIVAAKKSRTNAEKTLQQVRDDHIQLIDAQDAAYPELLKQVEDAPILLYSVGNLKPDWNRSIAIVGSRLATEYGKKVAHQLAEELSSNGWTVVSGLAIGIDGAAHKGALAGMIGSTVAVLGCGLRVVYPPQHKDLMSEIAEKGLIYSEYPPNLQPDARFFPQRNRIISGVTVGTIVVEAREKSGALLTADTALEQNRDLFAVPGMITSPMSKGPHRLIQKGAKLVTCADDILQEYNERLSRSKKSVVDLSNLSESIKPLISILASSPLTADKLAEHSGMPIGQVLANLTDMQMKGLVVSVGSEFHWNGGRA